MWYFVNICQYLLSHISSFQINAEKQFWNLIIGQKQINHKKLLCKLVIWWMFRTFPNIVGFPFLQFSLNFQLKRSIIFPPSGIRLPFIKQPKNIWDKTFFNDVIFVASCNLVPPCSRYRSKLLSSSYCRIFHRLYVWDVRTVFLSSELI